MTIKIVKIRTYKGDDVAYIGRGSPLENIWSSKPSKYKYVKKVDNAKIAVDNFKIYLHNKIKEKDRVIVNELKLMLQFYEENGSLALGCFCKDETIENDLFECVEHDEDYVYCHGEVIRDVLLRMLKLKLEKF